MVEVPVWGKRKLPLLVRKITKGSNICFFFHFFCHPHGCAHVCGYAELSFPLQAAYSHSSISSDVIISTLGSVCIENLHLKCSLHWLSLSCCSQFTLYLLNFITLCSICLKMTKLIFMHFSTVIPLKSLFIPIGSSND